MWIPLNRARLCLDCDTLHDQMACPVCGSIEWRPVSSFLPTMKMAEQPERSDSRLAWATQGRAA